MIKIVNPECRYPEIILCERNVVCSQITREEFILCMRDDINEACAEYMRVVPEALLAEKKRTMQKYYEQAMKREQAYARNKWKTERKRSEHLQKVEPALRRKYLENITLYKPELTYFDLDYSCGTTMTGSYCIDTDKLDDVHLGCIYEYVKKQKYFNGAIGWTIGYTGSEIGDTGVYRNAFRPHIKLKLPDNVAADAATAKKRLEDDIHDFYSGKKSGDYVGD